MLPDRFEELNRGKTYANGVKPFNFLISPIVKPIDRPPGEVGSNSHSIAPYSRNPLEWLRFSCSDIHSGEVGYRIRTSGQSNRAGIRVQTFNDILDHFRIHPEAKSASPDGSPSDSLTSGLLGRLHVHILTVHHIGKETNRLGEQEKGILLTDPQAVYSGAGEWEVLRLWLDRVSISDLAAGSGVSERMLRNLRQGDRRPSADKLEAIMVALARMLDEAEG
jgi:hypothetical protein